MWKSSCVNQPTPMCEIDSSSLWDDAFAIASGSSRGKGRTSLTDGLHHINSSFIRSKYVEKEKKMNLAIKELLEVVIITASGMDTRGGETLPADTVEGNQSW